jgi:hypothetical protein
VHRGKNTKNGKNGKPGKNRKTGKQGNHGINGRNGSRGRVRCRHNLQRCAGEKLTVCRFGVGVHGVKYELGPGVQIKKCSLT